MTTLLILLAALPGEHPFAAKTGTSLTDPKVRFSVPKEHHVRLQRSLITTIVADNEAIDVPDLPGHRAGYNGLASLTYGQRTENLFVPAVAGLNFEHIHDGTRAVDKERFEPRRSSMELRVIDEFTVEVYQPPTANWKLESCGRYQILPDGTIEYTFECIPRADTFQQGYVGLLWASYIDQPKDKAIHFLGRKKEDSGPGEWIRLLSPKHGVDSTHPPSGTLPDLKFDPRFSLTLANHPSPYVYVEPWYYGVSHGLAYVQMFRARDRIWFAQSPTGGGETNPAWDFQWFIPDVKVGEAYGLVMRAACIPYESREQVERATAEHRAALNPK